MNLSVLPEPFMRGSSGSDTDAEKEGKNIRSWESSFFPGAVSSKVNTVVGVVAMATASPSQTSVDMRRPAGRIFPSNMKAVKKEALWERGVVFTPGH